jgi:hypothetical protein
MEEKSMKQLAKTLKVIRKRLEALDKIKDELGIPDEIWASTMPDERTDVIDDLIIMFHPDHEVQDNVRKVAEKRGVRGIMTNEEAAAQVDRLKRISKEIFEDQ